MSPLPVPTLAAVALIWAGAIPGLLRLNLTGERSSVRRGPRPRPGVDRVATGDFGLVRPRAIEGSILSRLIVSAWLLELLGACCPPGKAPAEPSHSAIV